MNNLTSVQETSQVSPAEMKESKHKINTNIILSNVTSICLMNFPPWVSLCLKSKIAIFKSVDSC